MHLCIVLHYVGSVALIFMSLHFILKIHFCLRLPNPLEKGTKHRLLGRRSRTWLVTFCFSSHWPTTQVVTANGWVAAHWPFYFHGPSPAGLIDLSLLQLCPTWGSSGYGPCRFQRGEKRRSQQRTMRKTTPTQACKSLFLPFTSISPHSTPNYHHPSLQESPRVKAVLLATLTHIRQSFNTFNPLIDCPTHFLRLRCSIPNPYPRSIYVVF